jgi:predicted AlkP superfamily pyrophosphatase or phosphodiesterase
MRHLLFVFVFYGYAFTYSVVDAQSKVAPQKNNKTKLVIGIVVDQMRNDYIYRYWDRFSNAGFKRLVNDGFYFKNAHYNYIPTYTGPGHCSIYTGTTPRTHGIIGNDWFLKPSGEDMYCVKDTNVQTVGYSTNKNGRMSPRNQLSSTIGDEMKMSSNQRAKVFGIALKDRSSILPAGHAADAAFWYDDLSGNFISSTWYLKSLPQWVSSFNDKKLAQRYLQNGWTTMLPPETYSNSIADDNIYEAAHNKKEKAIFPYNYDKFLEKNNFDIIKATPYGNTLTKDLAITCIVNEQLGRDNVTDLLCLSFSSTDYVGHSYGPRSVEIEDTYLRLDRDIEELLTLLDQVVGKGNYTIFLTADHGAADVPRHLMDQKIAAGYVNEKQIALKLKTHFKDNYGDSLLLANLSNEQIFLDEKKLLSLKLDKNKVEEGICELLLSVKGIAQAYPSYVLKKSPAITNDHLSLLQNGYNHKLSGNVAYILEPAFMDYAEKGTTHGSGYNYDSHVPVLFYGNGIKKGESYNYISITQIAPTVCELLQINQPNSTISVPLNSFFK